MGYSFTLQFNPIINFQHSTFPTGGPTTLHRECVLRQGVALLRKLLLAVRIVLVCGVFYLPPAFDSTPAYDGGQGGYRVVLTVSVFFYKWKQGNCSLKNW